MSDDTLFQLTEEDKFFAVSNKVTGESPVNCAACEQPFTPSGYWEKRCDECRRLGVPRKTLVYNPGFTGVRTLPAGMRTYESGKGKTRYPSVTTILHPEGIDYPPELLRQYASRGVLIHKKIEHFLSTGGIWLTLRQLCEIYPGMITHVKLMKQGSLRLEHTKCNWIGFHAEHGHKFNYVALEQKVISHEHKYAGRLDAIGTFMSSPAIIDFKTASDYNQGKLDDYFMQLAAYAMASGSPIQRLVIVPLNPKSKNGYDTPIDTTRVIDYFNKFMGKRLLFKEMYGI